MFRWMIHGLDRWLMDALSSVRSPYFTPGGKSQIPPLHFRPHQKNTFTAKTKHLLFHLFKRNGFCGILIPKVKKAIPLSHLFRKEHSWVSRKVGKVLVTTLIIVLLLPRKELGMFNFLTKKIMIIWTMFVTHVWDLQRKVNIFSKLGLD